MNVKRLLNNILFFTGWLLSPLTVWNDAIINIPIAYVCASMLHKALPLDFSFLVILFYWGTNIAGILLLYLSGRNIIKEKKAGVLSVLKTLLIYSVILVVIDTIFKLKPIIVR